MPFMQNGNAQDYIRDNKHFDRVTMAGGLLFGRAMAADRARYTNYMMSLEGWLTFIASS